MFEVEWLIEKATEEQLEVIITSCNKHLTELIVDRTQKGFKYFKEFEEVKNE